MNRKALISTIRNKKSYLCVGLDTDVAKLPGQFSRSAESMLSFNKQIIDSTAPYCVAYKINTAFYEAYGKEGWETMQATFEYIPSSHLKIADAKRGDIGNTSAQYAKAFFETLNADAITVAPYMGEDSIRPFLEYKNKWTIVLALTSNSGASDFEMLNVGQRTLFEEVLMKTSKWGDPENLMFVVGATQESAFKKIREAVPDHFFLVPGVGAQGGSLENISRLAMNTDVGLLVNVSRGIMYAGNNEDFASAAAIAAKNYQQEMAGYL